MRLTWALLGVLAALVAPQAAAEPSHAYAVVDAVVYPGQTVEMVNVRIRQHSRAIPDDYPVLRDRDDLAGMIAVRTLLPGRAIAPDMVRAPFAVEAGGVITVSLKEGPLSIVMKAVALQDGTVGEAISVRNAENGRTICAVVRSASSAEVC